LVVGAAGALLPRVNATIHDPLHGLITATALKRPRER